MLSSSASSSCSSLSSNLHVEGRFHASSSLCSTSSSSPPSSSWAMLPSDGSREGGIVMPLPVGRVATSNVPSALSRGKGEGVRVCGGESHHVRM